MAVMLNRLKYRNSWITRLGALKGCMDYLGKNDSSAWLFGATGHAFILNISGDACPSGPTAWNCEMITNLAHNLGVGIEVVNAWRTEPEFQVKQRIAWENTKRALDNGLPCYGWELGVPEFYVICGYDEHGYYYKGVGTPTFRFAVESDRHPELWAGVLGEELRRAFESHGILLPEHVTVTVPKPDYAVIRDDASRDEFYVHPNGRGQLMIHDDYTRPSDGYKPWEELGASSIGWLHVGWLEPGAASDDYTTVSEALEFALEFAQSPSKWVTPGYKAGLPGYDNWLTALQTENPGDPMGLAYNGEVWAECRGHAAQFLREASERIGGQAGKLLLQAAEPYGQVALELGKYRSLLPFIGRSPEMLRDRDRMDAAIRAVQAAKMAEAQGLQALKAAYGCMEGA